VSDAPLRPDERAARDAIRSLPAPPTDPGYRERLRADFASGAIESRVRPRPGRPPAWAVPLAAAATLLAVVAALLASQGPRWTLEAVSGAGTVVVDGRTLASDDSTALARALRPGARLRTTGDAQIDLALPGCFLVQVTPGAEVVIPGAPARWFARPARGEVLAGSVRFVTGPKLRGSRLLITTPEASVEATGTTFAVIREPAGTCLCVLEGAVRMAPHGGVGEKVEAGMRRYVFNDGRPAEVAQIRPTEIGKLTMLRDRASRLAP
jgi:ferric-dicitrate binding protein FerR (iron transport regulator)